MGEAIAVEARPANGIAGSEAILPEAMKTAPEVVVLEVFGAAGKFDRTCSPKAQDCRTMI